jgi:DNA-binding beta-propeller fold protein YncE
MRRYPAILLVCTLVCAALAAAQDPKPTELPSKPFFIKKTWTIGGEGNWDYLTLDPTALQLFVAHGSAVQVVDVSAGTLAGQIKGMRDAHGIALDDTGEVGFVSDGPANQVRIFDRRTLQVVASVPTGPSPRAIVYEPLTKLVFAICTQPINLNTQQGDSAQPSRSRNNNGAATQRAAKAEADQRERARTATASSGDLGPPSVVTVIDASTQKTLGNLILPGRLGFAMADGRGEVYVSILDHSRIAHFNAQTLLGQIQQQAAINHTDILPVIDWSGSHPPSGNSSAENQLHFFRLGAGCQVPKGLAIDSNHLRIFAACDNQKMDVLNADTGEIVATLPIGPGTDAIGYDAQRGLIYTSNGGGLGSITVIRQDVADSYAVIQELPTKQRARTLAVNPTNGEVYLVTGLEGFDLNKKGTGGSAHALPVVQAEPVKGSFQVLVVGN